MQIKSDCHSIFFSIQRSISIVITYFLFLKMETFVPFLLSCIFPSRTIKIFLTMSLRSYLYISTVPLNINLNGFETWVNLKQLKSASDHLHNTSSNNMFFFLYCSFLAQRSFSLLKKLEFKGVWKFFLSFVVINFH